MKSAIVNSVADLFVITPLSLISKRGARFECIKNTQRENEKRIDL